MASLSTLNKGELQALANEQGVDGVDEDAQNKDEMIATLEAAGVTGTDGGGETRAGAIPASQRDTSQEAVGGTPGGASESQQPTRDRVFPGTGKPVLPDLDAVTALGVRPRPAGPRSPSLDYDDSAKG